MADFVDFRVWGAPPDALTYALETLAGDGYRVTARTEWSCLVEKGSSVNRAIAGGLAQRSILKLSVFDGGPGAALLRLEKQATGWSGGIIGAHRAGTAFEVATQRLGWSLQTAGRLL